MAAAADTPSTVSDRFFGIQDTTTKNIYLFPVLSPKISSFSADMLKFSLDDGTFLDINFKTLIIKFGRESYGFAVTTLSIDELEALDSEYKISPASIYSGLKTSRNGIIIFRIPEATPVKIKPAVKHAKAMIADLLKLYGATRREKYAEARRPRSWFEAERAEMEASFMSYLKEDEFTRAMRHQNIRTMGINLGGSENDEVNNDPDTFSENEPDVRTEAGGATAGASAAAAAAPPAAAVSAEEASRLAAAAEMRRRISEGSLDNKRDRMLLLQVLGVQKLKANPGEIRKAYRDLILTHHPDKGGNAEKFKNVEEAYSRLTGKGGGGTRKRARNNRRKTYKH